MCSLKQKLHSVFLLFVLTVYFFFLSYSVKLSQQVNNYVYLDRKLDFRISEREGQWYTQLFELEQCTTGTELSLSI